MMKTNDILCLFLLALLTGCVIATPEREGSLSIVYNLHFLNIPNDGEFKHQYGEDQPGGREIRAFVASQSAKLQDKNAVHVSVDLIPFSHAQACARPLDLRLEQAQLGAFINYVAEGKIQFLPDKRKLIPVETIEQNLTDLCQRLGIRNVTISRGPGWMTKKPHNY